MTKAGLEMFVKTAALEFAPLGIRVNAVAPCMVNSNLYRYAGLKNDENEALFKRAASNIPL